MIYELRTYTAMPGELPAVVDRFRRFTAEAQRRHGFRQIGFWTAQVGGENTQLIYMLQSESYEERNRCYDAIRSDPEQARVFAESEAAGPILASVLNVMLEPTDFSPLQ
jgi:hypothetical protein